MIRGESEGRGLWFIRCVLGWVGNRQEGKIRDELEEIFFCLKTQCMQRKGVIGGEIKIESTTIDIYQIHGHLFPLQAFLSLYVSSFGSYFWVCVHIHSHLWHKPHLGLDLKHFICWFLTRFFCFFRFCFLKHAMLSSSSACTGLFNSTLQKSKVLPAYLSAYLFIMSKCTGLRYNISCTYLLGPTAGSYLCTLFSYLSCGAHYSYICTWNEITYKWYNVDYICL